MGTIFALSAAINHFRESDSARAAQNELVIGVFIQRGMGGAMKSSYKLAIILALVLIPYFVFIFYLGLGGVENFDSLPDWFRWGLATYLSAGFLALSVAIIRFRGMGSFGQESVSNKAAQVQASTGSSNVKRLLILYLVFFPIGVTEALLQRQIPVKLALLALVVPILVIGGLWRTLALKGSRRGQ